MAKLEVNYRATEVGNLVTKMPGWAITEKLITVKQASARPFGRRVIKRLLLKLA